RKHCFYKGVEISHVMSTKPVTRRHHRLRNRAERFTVPSGASSAMDIELEGIARAGNSNSND
ncbi:hypothetical protein ABZ351_33465, partial [Streptomyces microflavus]|uniref:hypothetical protein n=1 Tax=Streptomyces microflavus TaxID=1919 RepID=UPI003411E14D